MRRRWLVPALAFIAVLAIGGAVVLPYLRSASLVVRAAHLGGTAQRLADLEASAVVVRPPHRVPTRHGEVAARLYSPVRGATRAVLLIPGIHSMGIEEPRLTALASDLAGARVSVMTMALPDLQAYRITPRATDVIEDAVTWMVRQPELASDGRAGIIGVSFAGGLALSAASRPAIRDKVAFVLSFGGHGDLPRVLHYLATGEAPRVPGLAAHPPHDYGVAVVLYGLADSGIVPADQVEPLRRGIETFLLASQLTLVSLEQADAGFAKAREMAAALPEPSRTLLTWVNERNVGRLGPAVLPYLPKAGSDGALSPERVSVPTGAPIYLIHGIDDTVIPAAESALLAEALEHKGARVRVLLSGLITHADVNGAPSAADVWKLIAFWRDVLRQ